MQMEEKEKNEDYKNHTEMINLNVEDIDLDNTYFHFTQRSNLQDISQNGLIPQKGDASKLVSESVKRVYISKTLSKTLRIKGAFFNRLCNCEIDNIPKGYRQYFEFEDDRQNRKVTKLEVFEAMKKRLEDEVYLSLDVKEGEDFDTQELVKIASNEEPHQNNKLHDLRCLPNHTIEPSKLRLLQLRNGANSGLDILRHLHSVAKERGERIRYGEFLDEFMQYVHEQEKNMEIAEQTDKKSAFEDMIEDTKNNEQHRIENVNQVTQRMKKEVQEIGKSEIDITHKEQ